MANAKSAPTVSVVIPVLNAAPFLPALLPALFAQLPAPPIEVVLVDSGSTDDTKILAAAFAGVRVIDITDFTHGKARNLGIREARGAVVVLLVQDALPRDNAWLWHLLEPLDQPGIAACYSRQLPRPDANPVECASLRFLYPPTTADASRTLRGGQRWTLETVFFSNVSAAAYKQTWLRFPFDENLIMSEDQQFSRDLTASGLKAVYQPDSVVVHSHNYPLKKLFMRHFDSIYSLRKIFPDQKLTTSVKIGRRLFLHDLAYLVANHPLWLPYYFLQTCCKATATILASYADQLPRPLVARLSMHAYYWSNNS
ncbi:MAG: glycosyltransferase [Magnetococcales bacterium]|nr:glycosyltransferase [Magnetococcales bacterium]